ncbi:MAG: hypothetical protein EH225_02160 [Calditrichaeota bacterium]|nr:hypothetical protein [Calditrichota bacterium]RQW07277.1 MAG: hypothetical protein EH225_02160 [Calditrichota bacterium]
MFCIPFRGVAQDKPISIKLFGGYEFQNESYKARSASGFGLSGQFNYAISSRFDLNFRLDYEQMNLTQDDVLFEWNWDYWEDTYVDFLPGITPQELNATLEYTSGDSIYSATFHPTQQLKEVRFSTGLEYKLPAVGKFYPFIGLNAGISLFYRELKMTENWTKRFNLDPDNEQKFDYEYKYELTHFAPSREGQKIFAEPVLGTRFFLTPGLDLHFAFHYQHYFDRDEVGWLEDLLHLSAGGEIWFPLRSKTKFTIGLNFKY